MYSIKPHGVASTNVSRSESINPHMDNSANNSEKNGVVAKVSGVFNRADLPTVSSRVSMDENRAACLITKCLRQVIANKSYNHMFQNGVMWSERAEGQTELGFRAMQKLSSENIRQLFCELAPLVQEEIGFLDNLLQMPFTATHASDANIVNEKGILSLFSRKKLEQRGMEFDESHSGKEDINRLSNDDFVFFSLEPGDKIQKCGSRFGHTLYRINFDTTPFSQVSWGSLQDQVLNHTGGSVEKYLEGLSDEAYEILTSRFIGNEKSMFCGENIKVGLGLSLLRLLRELPQEDRLTLLASRSVTEVNRVVNGIYRPEIKVPKHFFSKSVEAVFLCGNGQVLSASELDDKDKVLNVAKSGPDTLMHVSERLKDDYDVVSTALSCNCDALKYASFRFRDSEELVLSLIKKNADIIKYASPRLQDNADIVRQAVLKNGILLQFASDGLKDDFELVKLAVLNNGNALEFASERLKNNKEIVLLAVQSRGSSFRYASDACRDDFDLVLAAIENSPLFSVLKFASERVKNNKELVLEAVQNHGLSIEFASDALKNDIDVVTAAVESNKKALMFVSDEMKKLLFK
ncbi:hypothetical protein NVI2019_OHEONHNH_00728 [Providencia alcalifaciens]|nr:hypothetical protein NVI2019_OHEONHNH_00728 [Providencia alcalifaciens]CAG9416156.1 hypothetical protein NVI2019_OGMBKCAO_01224 [Providencia alcalifaciens]CAG9425792.1 hypothetical protein NVI2019_PLFLNFOB_02593 [Providencia alcalifaciens]